METLYNLIQALFKISLRTIRSVSYGSGRKRARGRRWKGIV